jgi:type IV pilus assembly protein PilM
MKKYLELFFKKKKNSLIGIDLTTHDIKIVELSKLADGNFKLDSYAYRELPGGLVSEDVVVDSQQVGQIIKDLIEENKMITRDVAISVPQNTVITQQVVVSGDNEREIESEIENSGKKYIHTDIDEVEFDFKILSESSDGNNKTILLVACKQKNITSRDDAIVIAGLEPKIVDSEAYVYERMFPRLVNQINYELAIKDEIVKSILMVELFEKKIKTVLINNGKTVYNEEQSIEIERRSMKTISLNDELGVGSSEQEGYKRGVYLAINKVLNLVSAGVEKSSVVSCIVFMGQEKYIDDIKEYVEDKLQINCLVANPVSGMEISDKINMIDLVAKAPLLVVACGLAMRENDYE